MFMKKNTGFTMIELMLVIAIAAVLMSIAIPAFKTATRNSCMTTSVNLLVTAVQLARSEAVKRRQDVRLKAGAPGEPAGGSANQWGGGWHVWFDANDNDSWDPNEELRVFTPTCELEMNATIANLEEFIYNPRGFVNISGGEVNVCKYEADGTGEQHRGRQLSVKRTGRPTVSDFNCPARE